MHEQFGEWYRVAKIQPEHELLERRWSGVEAFVSAAAEADVFDLSRLFNALPVRSESFLSACFTAQNTLGRGYLIGTATVVEQSVIEILADSVCVNDDNSKEDPVELTFRHSAAPKGDILIVPQGDFPDIFMHRTGD